MQLYLMQDFFHLLHGPWGETRRFRGDGKPEIGLFTSGSNQQILDIEFNEMALDGI